MEIAEYELFGPGDLIDVYTRADAIADGVLVDVSMEAKKAGFRVPVALTRAVWDEYVEVPECLKGVQNETGRLWDILYMTALTKRRAADQPVVRVFLMVANTRTSPRRVEMKAVFGPGDNGEIVATIMLPNED